MWNLRHKTNGGAWGAQSVKCLTLDLGSGHDLTVCEIEPCVRFCADSMEPAWNSLSLFLKYINFFLKETKQMNKGEIKRERERLLTIEDTLMVTRGQLGDGVGEIDDGE